MEHLCESRVSGLIDSVVAGDYCSGCGACAAVADSPLEIRMNDMGQYSPVRNDNAGDAAGDADVLSVCPFSQEGPDEDTIGKELFGEDAKYHDGIGYFRGVHAGHVKAGSYRRDGSSGGLTTWIVAELFRRGLIDAVAHVKKTGNSSGEGPLFAYTVSHTLEEIHDGAKSRYYPVEMSGVLEEIRRRPGRYAVVGIPCFIKSLRLLMRQDPLFSERIRYCVSLVCGHLKSSRYADLLAWQCGVPPGQIAAIDFRHKLPNRRASAYGVAVRGCNSIQSAPTVRPVADLYGSNWGYGLLKYNACDYCDDVFGETADISVGDAWLPGYVKDSQGNNVVVVRRGELLEIIESARGEGDLELRDLSPADAVLSQAGGLRHRREGLAYRLHLADELGQWRPKKRLHSSGSHIDLKLQEIQQMRMLLARKSHTAFRAALDADRFDVFREMMGPHIRRYDSFYKKPLWLRIASKIKNMLRQ